MKASVALIVGVKRVSPNTRQKTWIMTWIISSQKKWTSTLIPHSETRACLAGKMDPGFSPPPPFHSPTCLFKPCRNHPFQAVWKAGHSWSAEFDPKYIPSQHPQLWNHLAWTLEQVQRLHQSYSCLTGQESLWNHSWTVPLIRHSLKTQVRALRAPYLLSTPSFKNAAH